MAKQHRKRFLAEGHLSYKTIHFGKFLPQRHNSEKNRWKGENQERIGAKDGI